MPSSHSPTNRPDLVGPVLQSTHVIEKLAVSCGPADLHDARSDHCDFVVPHPSVHTEGATHTFKRGGITASLAKPKGVRVHHQCLTTTKVTGSSEGWLDLSLLQPLLDYCLLPCAPSVKEGRKWMKHTLFYSFISREF